MKPTVLLSSAQSFQFRLRPLAIALCIATSGSGGIAFAQIQPASVSTEIHQFNISAQPLGEALILFGQQTGLQVTADSNTIADKQAMSVSGAMTATQALNRLLAGTRLNYRVDGAMVSVQAPGEGASTLPAVRVKATSSQEDPLGPVGGYVAKHSVTGTKTDVPLIETPQTVSVVTGEQIETQGADSLDKVFGYSAGIYSTSGSGQRLTGTSFSLRGFNLENQKPLFVNGSRFPIQTLSGPEETSFYERIEILKGPASILYGQASPGGIINLVSKRPTLEQTAEVGVQVGSWDRRQVKADVGGPVSTDSDWGYRITGLVRDSETMIDQIPDDRQAFSGALSWTPSERTSLNIQATHQNNETIFVAGLPADGTILPNPNGKIARDFFQGEPGVDFFDIERQTVSYQLTHQFNDTWSFRQNVLRYDTQTEYKLLGAFRGSINAERREFDRFAQARLENEDGFSIDNQLQAEWKSENIEHTVLFGVDYSDSDFKQDVAYGGAEPINVFNPVYGTPVTFPEFTHSTVAGKQLGIYAQDHIKIAGRWVALLGGRWDDSDNNVGDLNPDADDFTLRAGLVYLFDNGLAPYLSYSESFQPHASLDANQKPFDPTTGEQFEIGLKYEPSAYNATHTLSVYEIVQQNVLTPDLDNPGYSVAQGEVESTGVEFETRAELNEHLGVIATYAYNHNEVTKDNDAANIGKKQVSQPRKMAAVWLDYKLLGDFLPGLTVSGGARYINGLLNSGNTVEVPTYSVVDAALQYQWEHNWKAQLNINNVFDKEYISACGYNCYYGDERNFVFSAVYTW